jgi:hypothetical protein
MTLLGLTGSVRPGSREIANRVRSRSEAGQLTTIGPRLPAVTSNEANAVGPDGRSPQATYCSFAHWVPCPKGP